MDAPMDGWTMDRVGSIKGYNGEWYELYEV